MCALFHVPLCVVPVLYIYIYIYIQYIYILDIIHIYIYICNILCSAYNNCL